MYGHNAGDVAIFEGKSLHRVDVSFGAASRHFIHLPHSDAVYGLVAEAERRAVAFGEYRVGVVRVKRFPLEVVVFVGGGGFEQDAVAVANLGRASDVLRRWWNRLAFILRTSSWLGT